MGDPIVLASDHRGFALKEALGRKLEAAGHEVRDLGPGGTESVNYPEFAAPAARAVSNGEAARGIVICGSGLGVAYTANRFPRVRAALVHDVETAAAARQHNDANMLALAGDRTDAETAWKIVETWLSTPFEGGRHTVRVAEIDDLTRDGRSALTASDPAIADVLRREALRQADGIELIASENFVSEAVLEAVGSVGTNKYAEGYPGDATTAAAMFVDEVENLAIERAKQLFGAEHANVQPHSGSQANDGASTRAVLEPGDTILAMNLDSRRTPHPRQPGELLGEALPDRSLRRRSRTTSASTTRSSRALAREHRPKLIQCGGHRLLAERSTSPASGRSPTRWGRMLFADIAHIAGLVAAGYAPEPGAGHAQRDGTTTHKTLRGPRGGMILCDQEFAKKDRQRGVPGESRAVR